MADIVVINKIAAASADVQRAVDAVHALNPRAAIVRASSPVRLESPERVAGQRVLVVEDGPTLTHGGMGYGAGYVAAVAAGAGEIVDPRLSAPPSLREVFDRYPYIGRVLPAIGYDAAQLRSLAEAIDASDAELVVSATPLDLAALLTPAKLVLRARYELVPAGELSLEDLLGRFLIERSLGPLGCS